MRKLAMVVTVGALCLLTARAVRGDAAGDNARLDGWWADLLEPEPLASRAMLGFAGRPTETVEFLKGRLLPLKIDAAEVRALFQDLGSDDAGVWKPAFEKLVYFDPRLAIGLKPLMDEVTEEPARNRLIAVLGDRTPESLAGKTIELKQYPGARGFVYQFESPGPGNAWTDWEAEDRVEKLSRSDIMALKRPWARAVMAMVLLKHIGTAEAWAVVEGMATGDARAEPTVMAKRMLAERAAGKEATTQASMDGWWADLAENGMKGE
jgi:hypothetical protein